MNCHKCQVAMNLIAALILVLEVVFQFANAESAGGLARGFNDDIDWRTFDDGKNLAKERKKPLMLLIHKSWCGACKALKPKFAESKEIADLSKNFIMVNVEDEEEPMDKKFQPDGGYIPRILFLDSQGEIHQELYNENGNKQYKYYYPDPEDIVKTMTRATEQLTSSPGGSDEL